MVDRVDLGHHSQGRIPARRKMAEAAGGVAGGLRTVTLPALTTASTAAIAAVLAAACKPLGHRIAGERNPKMPAQLARPLPDPRTRPCPRPGSLTTYPHRRAKEPAPPALPRARSEFHFWVR
jgi:hypothetical protein